MNGKTAKLLRELSGLGGWVEYGLGGWVEYALNKRIWNASPRPDRGALREGALAVLDERATLAGINKRK